MRARSHATKQPVGHLITIHCYPGCLEPFRDFACDVRRTHERLDACQVHTSTRPTHAPVRRGRVEEALTRRHVDVTRHAVSCRALLRTRGRGTAPCTHATADCRQPQQQRHHRPNRHLRHPCGSPSLRLALRLLTRTRTGFTPAAHTVTPPHARTHGRCQTSHTDALTSSAVWAFPKRLRSAGAATGALGAATTRKFDRIHGRRPP